MNVVELKQDAPAGLVKTTRHGSVLRLEMNNPPANALSIAMMEALKAEFDAARDDKSVRVVILASATPGKLFCAGHDLKELTVHRADEDRGRAFFARTMKLCAELMQTIVHLPVPVLAEVDGLATAAGCQLVASCDLAFCTDTSTFCTPGRQYRTVLLDTDGGALPQRAPQAGHGNAAHRRNHRRLHRP
jgi:enoyl-CoA hydratase/carnithine racemase